MNIWIINPFDELPGDTDIRHRYWTLADTLGDMGHAVTWWSSNFSHRAKNYRQTPAPQPSNWNLKQIPTPPYVRNVSLARLRNHRAFARGFLLSARQAIHSGELPPPDRIVVSLPPLGTAENAFALRNEFGGEVIIDIMDAWPETFYRAFPSWVPELLRRFLLSPLHRSAGRAYRQADRISAVSQIYVDLARRIRDEGNGRSEKENFHLCYHGIDLTPLADRPSSLAPSLSSINLTYIGALERSYDLETAIRAVHALNAEGLPVELHIAGAGTHEASLKVLAASLERQPGVLVTGPEGPTQKTRTGNDSPTPEAAQPLSRVHFHGLLNHAALQELLSRAHIGLIPMRQDSWVGLPYKLGDYCAAGLAVVSSLDGECRRLLETKKAGSFYEPGKVENLKSAIRRYREEPEKLMVQRRHARELAEECFDRKMTYPKLAAFISGKD